MTNAEFLDFWELKLVNTEHFQINLDFIKMALSHYGTNLELDDLNYANLLVQHANNPSPAFFSYFENPDKQNLCKGELFSLAREALHSITFAKISEHFTEFQQFRNACNEKSRMSVMPLCNKMETFKL